MPVSTPSLRPLTAFVGVFALAAACAGTLIWTLESQDRAEQRSQAADMAGDHVQALQRAIELALSANNALVALVRQGRGSVPQFEEIGTQMLPFYPGIAAMGLSPSGVVRQVVPRQGNEGAMDFDMLHDPQQGTESAHARASGRLTLAGPMELAQGGLGVVGRQPVYLDDEQGQRSFWGFTYVAIRLPDVLAAARLDQLTARGYRYRLWRVRPDNGQEQTIAASTPPAGAGAMSRSLALPNGQWTLGLTPAQGWGAAGVLALRCALGLLFALL
ncbi:diguanylate phosphodiesterase, partial [Verminephrobacter sp. Larva24]